MRKRSVSHSRSVSPPTKRAPPVRQIAEPEPSNMQQEQIFQPEKEPKLFVCSLDLSVSKEQVKALFETYGQVVDIFHKTNEKGGIAFITFSSLEIAEKSLECNGVEMNGKKIKVQFAKPRANNGERGNRTSFGNRQQKNNNFREGGNRGQERKKTCFKCSKEGHFAKDCTQSNENNDDNNRPRKKTCFKCSKEGHFSSNCPENDISNNDRGQRKKNCFKCSKEGHFANNCPESNTNNEAREHNFIRERRSDNRQKPNRYNPRRQRNFNEDQIKPKENVFPTGRVDYVNNDNIEDRFKVRESKYGKTNSIQIMGQEKPIPNKVIRKRSVSRSGSPVVNRKKADTKDNENISHEVKRGFQQSKKANVSRSRSRSNDNKSNIARRKRSPSNDY